MVTEESDFDKIISNENLLDGLTIKEDEKVLLKNSIVNKANSIYINGHGIIENSRIECDVIITGEAEFKNNNMSGQIFVQGDGKAIFKGCSITDRINGNGKIEIDNYKDLPKISEEIEILRK